MFRTFVYKPPPAPKRPHAIVIKILRVVLLVRDGPYCGICDEWIDFQLVGTHSEMSPSVDHIVALADGGSNELDNLQLAHRRCDSVKSSVSNRFPLGWKHGLSKQQQRDVIAWRRNALDKTS